jgi:hypothetical protein
LTKAEELEVIVLEKRRQILGLDHPETLATMTNLANTYRDQGKLTEAEELEVIVLGKRRQILGPDHPETLAAMENLAKTYQGLGKLTQTEELEVAVLEKTSQTMGPALNAKGNLPATVIYQPNADMGTDASHDILPTLFPFPLPDRSEMNTTKKVCAQMIYAEV